MHVIQMLAVILALLGILTQVCPLNIGGCSDDSTCTELCGYAGTGRCVNSTHCVCETCPQRSTAEISLAYALKVCTPEPLCQLKCPRSSFSNLYSGHVCSTPKSLPSITCICFCMPLTIQSLGTVLRCPVLPNTTLSGTISGLLG